MSIAAVLNIADSRFQDGLKREAQAAGKLRADFQIPELHRNNTPRALEERFILARARGLFSEFPFGTDLTDEEIVLAKALGRSEGKDDRWLAACQGPGRRRFAWHPERQSGRIWSACRWMPRKRGRNGSGSDCSCVNCAISPNAIASRLFLGGWVSNLAIPAYPAERLYENRRPQRNQNS